MTGHDGLVAFTGLLFLAAALVFLAVFRQLGPQEYVGGASAPWRTRLFFLILMFVFAWRGLSLIFPGEDVHVSKMTINVTATAAAVLALSVWVLDQVLRERNPPPILERLLRVARREGAPDAALEAMAFASPVGLYKGPDVARAEFATTKGRKRKFAVIGGAVTLLLLIAAALIAGAA